MESFTGPEIAALLGSFRALVTGQLEALERTFETDYSESVDDDWTLVLSPLESDVGKRLKRLEVRGTGHRVDTIETHSNDGRVERMTLVNPVEAPSSSEPVQPVRQDDDAT